ncbi:hypothetical protein DNH61_02640 [Paenibacillus sambharensis]|uniref:Uncharacterized protein n=1 Tax=Paenibacillus sambharensis TaxID=1803190 RepID=A0A2W1LQP4_9BACL|nr:hypothetical protein [Paenibacillus sambharensis]PZD97272.1 hypothetical protein DNH61_02640 [Paenibacillus sambharensis]
MTIISIVAAILIAIYLHPYGLILIMCVTFGLVLSNRRRTMRIESDLQKIKEKLGIEEKDEFNMPNEEIEEELEAEYLSEEERIKLNELNKQIENELEEYDRAQEGENNKGK